MNVSKLNLLIEAASYVERQELQRKQQQPQQQQQHHHHLHSHNRKRAHSESVAHKRAHYASSATATSATSVLNEHHQLNGFDVRTRKESLDNGRSSILNETTCSPQSSPSSSASCASPPNGTITGAAAANGAAAAAAATNGSGGQSGNSSSNSNSNNSNSGNSTRHQSQLGIQNSFDLINPLMIDEGSGEMKRKQPPLVFRGDTRDMHNKLEKHRRALLKQCFDTLKKQLPSSSYDKKASNLSILHCACKTIEQLQRQETESEQQIEQLSRKRIDLQMKLVNLKNEISSKYDVDVAELVPSLQFTEHVDIVGEQLASGDKKQVQQQQQQCKENGAGLAEAVVKAAAATAAARATVTLTAEANTALKQLSKSITTTVTNGLIKEEVQRGTQQQQQQQQTALSVVPVPVNYQVNPGFVLQKLLVSQVPNAAPVAHLIAAATATAQPHHHHHHHHHHAVVDGKTTTTTVLPLVNTQYVMKPLVVVSTPSRPS